MALEIAERGAFALASIKAAFNARHGGVGGLARVSHDLLLRGYLETDESDELAQAFAGKRKPDPASSGTDSPLMSTLLTLSDPRRRAGYYAAGVWRDDTLYSLLLAPRAGSPGRLRAARCARAAHLGRSCAAGSMPWRPSICTEGRRAQRPARGGVAALARRSVVTLLACARNGYVCNPSLHQNYTVAEIVTLLRAHRCAALFMQPGYGADAKRADVICGSARRVS